MKNCQLLLALLPFLFHSCNEKNSGGNQTDLKDTITVNTPVPSNTESEFSEYSNGLIYSRSTIMQLKHIVDSLNLRHKQCDPGKIYLSELQGKGHFILLNNGNLKAAINDLKNNISYEEFISRYKVVRTYKNSVILKHFLTDYYGKKQVLFEDVTPGRYKDVTIKNKGSWDIKGKWVYELYTGDVEQYIKAFYIVDEFSKRPIPLTYSTMIQYGDCLIDTSSRIFYENAFKNSSVFNSKSLQIERFMRYLHEKISFFESGMDNSILKDIKLKDAKLKLKIDSLKKRDKHFVKLYNAAFSDGIRRCKSNEEFENCVGKYFSKREELELKRHRLVTGFCSMDRGPRIHALEIAKLSAETINWEIFLRAHLDIMNDRFDRMSDGSYAQKERKTYMKELQELNIDVLQLLVGICLAYENPAENHYYGDIARIGRALADYKDTMEIERLLIKMMSDSTLDDNNRIRCYYLYLNYNYNIEDNGRQETSKKRSIIAVKTLPEYLSEPILDALNPKVEPVTLFNFNKFRNKRSRNTMKHYEVNGY